MIVASTLTSLLLCIASLPSAFAVVRNVVTSHPDYYVLLSNSASGDDTFRCSGVLIYEDLVLTSAQCAAGNITHARVGYKDDDTTTVNVTGILRHVNSHKWSPNHNNRVADIAIIALDVAISKSVTYPTVHNPTMPSNVNRVGEDYVVFGAGDFRQGGATASFLHGDKVTTTPFVECRTIYRAMDRRVVLNKKHQFCAGNRDMEAGPCSIGDWGAPMLKLADETAGSKEDILIGLASFGNPGCGEHDPSFVYTRIATHYEWIQRSICFESANPPDGCELAYTRSPSASPTIKPYDVTNFFVVLSDTARGRGTERCGGSLLAPTLVLTAASCLDSIRDATNLVARVGYETDERSFAVRKVSDIVQHPDSKGQQENYPNDVAIVVLEDAVYGVSTVTVNTIKAFPPDNSFPLQYREAGSSANQVVQDFRMSRSRSVIADTTAMKNATHNGDASTCLFQDCREAYKKHAKAAGYYASSLDESKQFCIVAGGVDDVPCNVGAWGSPLYEIQNDESILQVGVYSTGHGCNDNVLPDVYTRLASYADWIETQVCRHAAAKSATECDEVVVRDRGLRSAGSGIKS